MFVVTAVDTADTADGKARVLAHCSTHDEAKNFVKHDIEDFINDAAEMNPVVRGFAWAATYPSSSFLLVALPS